MLKPIFEFEYFGQNIYVLFGAIGVLFGLLVFLKKLKLHKVSANEETKILMSFLVAAPLGLIMSNITNWFFMPELFQYNFIQRFTQAGFNFYGGILFFLLISYILLRIFKLDYKKLMNEIIPSILIFHAFGRVGCSLSGCCYGFEMFPNQIIEHTNLHLFPAREIEAAMLFILFFIFNNKIKNNRVSYYLISYGTIRFTLEFFRGDKRGNLLIPGMSPAQTISLTLILVTLLIYLYKKFTYKNKMIERA